MITEKMYIMILCSDIKRSRREKKRKATSGITMEDGLEFTQFDHHLVFAMLSLYV